MTVIINGTTGITNVNGTAAAPAETGTDTDSGIVYGTNTVSLATNGTTALTVDSSQNVGIGTSSPSQKLNVSGGSIMTDSGGSTSSPSLMISSGALGTAGLYAPAANTLGVVVSSTERMRIDSSGNLTVPAMYGTTVTTPRNVFIDSSGKMGGISSIRASKSNITPVTDSAWLYQVSPVTFNYRKRDENDNYLDEIELEIQYGLIAEDVEAVKPEFCIYVEKEGKQVLQGVHYDRMISPLIKAIQEQQTLITALTARITALEANNG
jgi:hypothetical protein